jgi:hypothetical protein
MMIFTFVSRKLFFLSKVPLAPDLFDSSLRLWTLFSNHKVLDMIDEVEDAIGSLDGVNVCKHKYGGIEFRKNNSELGHIHGHGLADIHLSLPMKKSFMADHIVHDHHKFINSSWISVLITDQYSKEKVIEIFKSLAINRKDVSVGTTYSARH